jgi:hypothetical protein
VDFNDTDGTNIVLIVGANLDDEISVIAYGTFLLADHYSKTVTDGLLDLKANQATTYTKTEVDTALDALSIGSIAGLQTALDGKIDDSQVLTNVPSGAVFTDTTYTIQDGGLSEKNFTTADNTKLDGIESGATADQTATEIETLYEGLTNTNKYTDAEKALLANQSGVNTGDQTDITGNAGTVTNGVYTTDIGVAVQAYNADTVIDANYIAYTQTEKDKVNNTPENTNLVLGTTILTRFDKILGSIDIVDMEYLSGDLVTVRYTGDNNIDTFYRDVLEYSDGELIMVKHYYNTTGLIVESGLTTLVYDTEKNLISSNYTEA